MVNGNLPHHYAVSELFVEWKWKKASKFERINHSQPPPPAPPRRRYTLPRKEEPLSNPVQKGWICKWRNWNWKFERVEPRYTQMKGRLRIFSTTQRKRARTPLQNNKASTEQTSQASEQGSPSPPPHDFLCFHPPFDYMVVVDGWMDGWMGGWDWEYLMLFHSLLA